MSEQSFPKADEEAERVAEAEIAACIAAASAAAPNSEISGLGPSEAAVHHRSDPPAKPQYSTALADSEKPLLLLYFTIQGLGEGIRLLLAEAGMPHECIGVVGGEDQALACEWRARSPNGLLPMLSGAGITRAKPLSQSGSILRFLAGRLGMGGVWADILYETAKDLGGFKKEMAAAGADRDCSVAKGPFATGKRIERMLADMPDPADAGAALNYGQIQLFNVLLGCEDRRKGCVGENLGSVLDTFRTAMENRSGLKEYLQSTARYPLTLNELGEDGGYVYSTGPLNRGDIKYAA